MDNGQYFTPRDVNIQENGVDKPLNTSIIRTGAEGSGRARWIPEEDTERANVIIKGNGDYSPQPYYGFYIVDVNVAGGVSDSVPDQYKRTMAAHPSTTAGSSLIGRDPETGALMRVSLRNVDGETVLSFEEVDEDRTPSGIIVLMQPAKTRYKDGQRIDYSGMTCVLVDENGNRFTNEDYPTGDIYWLPASQITRPDYDTLVTPITTAAYEGEEGAGQFYQILPVQWTSPYDQETYEAKAYIVVEEVQS